MTAHPTRGDLFALDIDLRLAAVWGAVADGEFEPDLLDVLGSAMRTAYGLGYRDALLEPTAGQLLVDHDYTVPERRAA